VRHRHLFLTGYRGCGKSTIGRCVADLLDCPFLDTDVEIEAKASRTIAEIFADLGEAGFRDLESNQIDELDLLREASVISLGGGSIVRVENRITIRELGRVVWLQATPEILCERIANDASSQLRRPKLSKLGDLEEIRHVLSQRRHWYEEVSDMAISTDDQSMESIATQIADWYRE